MYSRVAKLVCFGRGGDSVDYGGGCTGSGYGTPERPHAADPSTHEIPDGTPVIDKRPAIDTAEGYAWVFKGPMVDVDLVDGECSECPHPSALFAGAMAGNSYGALLAVHEVTRQTAKRGALDRVSLREYIDGWREHGARIGHYENGAIVWDN